MKGEFFWGEWKKFIIKMLLTIFQLEETIGRELLSNRSPLNENILLDKSYGLDIGE